jgi:hypothetical protein
MSYRRLLFLSSTNLGSFIHHVVFYHRSHMHLLFVNMFESFNLLKVVQVPRLYTSLLLFHSLARLLIFLDLMWTIFIAC